MRFKILCWVVNTLLNWLSEDELLQWEVNSEGKW